MSEHNSNSNTAQPVCKRGTTDLSDQEWEVIAPYIAQKPGPGRRRTINVREVLNAIRYLKRTGCDWHMLPKEFPDRQYIEYYLQKWTNDGTLRRIRDYLLDIPGISVQQIMHRTNLGAYCVGDSSNLLRSELSEELRGRVQLILTSPPFPLNNKKSYGNLKGDDYRKWFSSLATTFADLLTEDGSIVIEMGNAWVSERPVQSLLHLESLIDFVENPDANLRLCQQFVCYNPSRLPSPAQWVTVKRIRVKDSYTHIWWMSKTDFPKADNRKVLRPYSESMKSLLKRRSYNTGKRPSEHHISEDGFLVDHGGSIAPNFFELEPLGEEEDVRLPNAFSISNTESNDFFLRTCRERGIDPHPARMPAGLAAFFIQFLTDPNDLVLDPFAGSNTTGFTAECLGRRWIAIEAKAEYAEQSMIRFEDPLLQ